MSNEKSGGPVNYYLVWVTNPNQGSELYQAECGDIIEALGMDFNEGCEFKAIWRTAAARTLGLKKEGGDALYDAQKRVFYAERSLSVLQQKLTSSIEPAPESEKEAASFHDLANVGQFYDDVFKESAPPLQKMDAESQRTLDAYMWKGSHFEAMDEMLDELSKQREELIQVPPFEIGVWHFWNGLVSRPVENARVRVELLNGIITPPDYDQPVGFYDWQKVGHGSDIVKFCVTKYLPVPGESPLPPTYGLSPASVAMNEARKGGLTDSECNYLAFPNNICNKCGRGHNGLSNPFPTLNPDEDSK